MRLSTHSSAEWRRSPSALNPVRDLARELIRYSNGESVLGGTTPSAGMQNFMWAIQRVIEKNNERSKERRRCYYL